MLDIDTDKVAEIIKHVAATEIMPRYNNLQAGDVREKKKGDPVTVADEASERALTALLQDYYPESMVVGEEAFAKDPSVLERFWQEKPVWVLDPIDGTRQFVSGSGRFGVLVALVQNGETLYGWMLDAIEGHVTVTAKGSGTYVNGERVMCAVPANTHLSALALGYDSFSAEEMVQDTVAKHFRAVEKLGCSMEHSTDYLRGVAPELMVHVGGKNAWDIAAGILAIEEAGGYVRINHGATYTPRYHGYGVMLVAPDQEIWQKTYDILNRNTKAYKKN